jgi:AraC-like DNA-binding protein
MLISWTSRGQRIALLKMCSEQISGVSSPFYIHYWGASPNHLNNHPHRHSFFEICFVTGGNGSYLEDGIVYPMKAGTMLVSRPGIEHQIVSDSGLEMLWVAFELIEAAAPALLADLYRRLAHCHPFVHSDTLSAPSAQIWLALWQQSEWPQPHSTELASALVYSLLMSFPQQFVPNIHNQTQDLPPLYAGPNLLNQAKLYVRDNLDRPLGLEEVAGYLHISGRHLSRLFEKERAGSFSKYVREERLKKADYWLSHSTMPIKRIAELCGFGNVHYFTKVFKDEKKQPPGRYRSVNSSGQ